MVYDTGMMRNNIDNIRWYGNTGISGLIGSYYGIGNRDRFGIGYSKGMGYNIDNGISTW